MEKPEQEIWDDAVEIWTLAQLMPDEGMEDGISRIKQALIRMDYAVVKKE